MGNLIRTSKNVKIPAHVAFYTYFYQESNSRYFAAKSIKESTHYVGV